MNTDYPLPPVRDLPPDRVDRLAEHLRAEIDRAPRSLKRPALGAPRLHVARPVLGAVVAALAALILVPVGGASLGERAVNGISSLWATQETLDAVATDGRTMAGPAYYTDARVNDATNTVDIYLANAPQSVIDQLQSAHPGVYVIHNDAAHPLDVLLQLQQSLPPKVDGVQLGPSYATPDGYLKVGIATTNSSEVQTVQTALDSLDGAGVIEVYGGAEQTGSTDHNGLTGPAVSPTKQHRP